MRIGDRVAFKAAFLRSICDYSHEKASMRGTIIEFPIEGLLARVDWGLGHIGNVNVANLILKDRVHLEPV